MSGSTLPQAFKLVRQLLSERPRAFQEILRDGLPSASASAATASIATVKGKGKLVAGESHVPEGHPFVSASYVSCISHFHSYSRSYPPTIPILSKWLKGPQRMSRRANGQIPENPNSTDPIEPGIDR